MSGPGPGVTSPRQDQGPADVEITPTNLIARKIWDGSTSRRASSRCRRLCRWSGPACSSPQKTARSPDPPACCPIPAPTRLIRNVAEKKKTEKKYSMINNKKREEKRGRRYRDEVGFERLEADDFLVRLRPRAGSVLDLTAMKVAGAVCHGGEEEDAGREQDARVGKQGHALAADGDFSARSRGPDAQGPGDREDRVDAVVAEPQERKLLAVLLGILARPHHDGALRARSHRRDHACDCARFEVVGPSDRAVDPERA
eukprot:3931643-Rhodomonas_salina.3